MKKIILLIMAFAFIANHTYAQEERTDFRSKLEFGMKIGGNYSNVYDTKGEEFRTDPIFGIALGAFVAIPIGKYIGIQPELMISQKGFKATGVVLQNSYSITRRTNYLDIPILFSLKPVDFLTIQIGPQYSYLMKQKDEFENTTTSILQEKEFENDNIRKNTLCFTAGADVNIEHLVVGARVGWDILNNNGDGTSTTPRYKNVWYQFTLGYRFF